MAMAQTDGGNTSRMRSSDARRLLRAIAVGVPAAFTYSHSYAAENVCESEMVRAAAENNVPVAVLYAVALTETGQRGALNAYAMNVEGRARFNTSLDEALVTFETARRQGAKLIDLGCMQINHHYHRARFQSVEEMFDPRRNVDYAARFLKALRANEGSWTAAVARYHAGPGNAPAQRRYVCAVIANMVSSGFGAWTADSARFCGR